MGVTEEPQQLDFGIDGVRVWSSTGGGPAMAKVRGDQRDQKVLAALHFRLPVKAGSHLIQAYFVQRTTADVDDLFDPYLRRDPYRAGNGEPGISSLTITAPSSHASGVAGAGANAAAPDRAIGDSP